MQKYVFPLRYKNEILERGNVSKISGLCNKLDNNGKLLVFVLISYLVLMF